MFGLKDPAGCPEKEFKALLKKKEEERQKQAEERRDKTQTFREDENSFAWEFEIPALEKYRTTKQLLEQIMEKRISNKELRLNAFTHSLEYKGQAVTQTRISRDLVLAGYSPSVVNNALSLAIDSAEEYYPIQEYINNLPEWDGQDRLPGLYKALGIDEEEEGDTISPKLLVRRWLKGVANRWLNPGSKLDSVLVLAGPQGYRKSTFFAALLPNEEWIAELGNISSKDSIMIAHSKALIELAELDGVFRKDDIASLKARITQNHDTWRPPYGKAHDIKNQPRLFAFCGTVNVVEVLRDFTGNRRFWMIQVTKPIDTDWVLANREQLWAEILKKEIPTYLNTSEVAALEKYNKFFTERNPLEQRVRQVLFHSSNELLSKGFWKRSSQDTYGQHCKGKSEPLTFDSLAEAVFATHRTISNYNNVPANIEPKDARTLRQVMQQLGFEKKRKKVEGTLYYCYFLKTQ